MFWGSRRRVLRAGGCPRTPIKDLPRPIKEDPTLLREGRLQRFLRKPLKNGHLDRCVYDKIYPSGSQPARIYGLPKMHKAREPSSIPPFRPIVSSIGTYNYELAKYLCILLEPHIPSEHCALDTFSLLFVKSMNCLYRESSWFPLTLKVCLQTYP